jgi:phage tail protein X
MKIIKTIMIEGDNAVLDRVIFEATGREDQVPAVLDANPGLAQLGPVLPVGTLIKVPESPLEDVVETLPITTLWSE